MALKSSILLISGVVVGFALRMFQKVCESSKVAGVDCVGGVAGVAAVEDIEKVDDIYDALYAERALRPTADTMSISLFLQSEKKKKIVPKRPGIGVGVFVTSNDFISISNFDMRIIRECGLPRRQYPCVTYRASRGNHVLFQVTSIRGASFSGAA
jgi:hypothetical protein